MYKVIRKAITKELAEFCYDYFCMKRQVAKVFRETYARFVSPQVLFDHWGSWNVDSQIPNTYSHYGDMVMETLLKKLKSCVEKESGLTLHPTYSYARIYKNGDVLERHRDRESCKVSTTLNLGGDPWPIFLEPSGECDKKGISILLEPGDMLLYDGYALEHWREKFEGKDCGQVFLHYNDAKQGDEFKYDKRPFLGLPPVFKDLKRAET